jgi:hypothetical protein
MSAGRKEGIVEVAQGVQEYATLSQIDNSFSITETLSLAIS